MVNEGFCAPCQRMLADEGNSDMEYFYRPHHSDGKSFQQALDIGCCICLQSWVHFNRPDVLGRTTYCITTMNMTKYLILNITLFRSSSESNNENSPAAVQLGNLHSKGPQEEHLQEEDSLSTDSQSGGFQWDCSQSEGYQPRNPQSRYSEPKGSLIDYPHELVVKFTLEPWSINHAQMATAPHSKNESITYLSENTRSAHSYAFLASKLAHCRTTHQKCSFSRTSQHLPTRLLDLGGEECESIRVVGGEDVCQDAKYATLSHFWGELLSQRLTRSIEAMLSSGVAICDPPKTFQDAIEVSRKTRKPYLWIDSL